jgi:hypothetical protein
LLIVEKIDALLNGVTRKDIEHLRPAQRQRLAAVLRHIANLADPPQKPEEPKTGVLFDLRDGRGAQ